MIKTQNTPDTSAAKRLINQTLSLTPEVSTPSQKYSTRTNAGLVVASHGEGSSSQFKSSSHKPEVSWLASADGDVIGKPYMYMYEKLRDSAEVIEDKINILADQIKTELNVEDWTSLRVTSNVSVIQFIIEFLLS